MAQASWDVIIAGQGLAGTTLAWHLIAQGQRVLLLDACERVTSSKIAAGLITPITGKRMALSRGYEEFFPEARKFYASVEKLTGRKFFHDRSALRLFRGDCERENWAARAARPEFQTHLLSPQPEPLLDPEIGDAGYGGFAMRAAQLDVAAYLEASRSVLAWEAMTIAWHRDVKFDAQGVSIRGRRARRLISCEGFAASRNPYFQWVPFLAAKGDILTLRVEGPAPPQSLHRGIWVAPTAEPDIFHVGSSYDWDNLDQTPSAPARARIERELKAFFRLPYEVLDHRAAVRPIISESKALVGLHPEQDALGYFNGLGSKGALHAPWYARCLTALLVGAAPLPEGVDIGKHFVGHDARH